MNFVETKSPVESLQLHARLGHMSIGRMKDLINHDMVEGLHTSEVSGFISKCDSCAVAKAQALPHKAPEPRVQYSIAELIVGDYKGPVESASLGGATGYFIFKDARSAYAQIYPVKSKDGSTQMEKFIQFKNWIERQTGQKIRKFRHDRGMEFLSTTFQNYLVREGIEDQTTAGYSPESNTRAESHIRILDKSAKSMLAHAGLPKEYWSDAYETANYIYNRSPTKALTKMTPLEALTGVKPRIDHLRVFGCKAVAFVPKELRRPLDFSGQVVRFVGYEEHSDAYRLWNGQKYVSSRDVRFDEAQFNVAHESDTTQAVAHDWAHFYPVPGIADPVSSAPPSQHETNSEASDDTFFPAETPEESSGDVRPIGSAVRALTSALSGSYWQQPSSRRVSRPATQAEQADLAKEGYEFVMKTPRSYNEALNSPEREHWQAAIDRELESLQSFGAFSRVDKGEQSEILCTSWRFARKPEAPFYKARLCVRGDQETDLLDTEDVFASVVRTENLKLLLTLISTFRWHYLTLDVSSAFLHAELKKDVYIHIPQGMEFSKTQCLKLLKALYGLREAPAAWNEELTGTLLSMGFKKNPG